MCSSQPPLPPDLPRSRPFSGSSGFRVGRVSRSKVPSPLEGEGQGGGYGGVEGRSLLHEPAQPVSAVCPLVLTPMGSVARRPPSLTLPLKGGGDRSAPPCRTEDSNVGIGHHRVEGVSQPTPNPEATFFRTV